MTSILNLEPWAPRKVEATDASERGSAPETSEYEIVLGRAQIASWLFVFVIAVAVCSSLAYLAAETITAKKTAQVAASAQPVSPSPTTSSAASQIPETSIPKTAQHPVLPLFAEPETGKVYLQIGAVEKGMAMILVDGLRGHGLAAFVGPGPNDKIFRVLIGPLPDPQAFMQAMVAVDALDLATFARKYQK